MTDNGVIDEFEATHGNAHCDVVMNRCAGGLVVLTCSAFGAGLRLLFQPSGAFPGWSLMVCGDRAERGLELGGGDEATRFQNVAELLEEIGVT